MVSIYSQRKSLSRLAEDFGAELDPSSDTWAEGAGKTGI
jgi:hypothetical protein